MKKVSTTRFMLLLVTANFFIPLFFVQGSQLLSQLFNPDIDADLRGRLAASIKPFIYILFTGAQAVFDLFLARVLSPLFRYVKDGTRYEKARTAAISVPWILVIGHSALWLVSNFLFYAAYRWKTPGGMPFGWSLSLNILAGLWGAALTVFVINNLLVPWKAALAMGEIRDGEKDLFVRVKIPFLFLVSAAGFIVYPAYCARYYIESGSRGGVGSVIIVGAILSVILFLSLILALRDDKLQAALLKAKLTDLAAGKGDLTQRVTLLNFDNVGEIAAAINEFIEQLRAMMIEVEKASAAVQASSEELEETLLAASGQIGSLSEAVEKINRSCALQKETVVEAERALSVLVDSLQRIGSNTEAQASFVEQTSGAMNEMASSIGSVSTAASHAGDLVGALGADAEHGKEALARSREAILGIEESSKSVSRIVTEIGKISALTNLLAMNASIEAAHAGASGSGFAVVADEVRKLAEESSQSAKQITAYIKEMKERVRNGVELVSETNNHLESIFVSIPNVSRIVREIDNAMEEQNRGSAEVLDAISSVVSSSQEIRDLTGSELASGNGLQARMESLVRGFTRVEEETRKQSESGGRILEAVSRLREIAGRNREISGSLNAMISRFTLHSP